jgi:hypothetical protein
MRNAKKRLFHQMGVHTQGLVHLLLAQPVNVAPPATTCCSFWVNFLTVVFFSDSFLFFVFMTGCFG